MYFNIPVPRLLVDLKAKYVSQSIPLMAPGVLRKVVEHLGGSDLPKKDGIVDAKLVISGGTRQLEVKGTSEAVEDVVETVKATEEEAKCAEEDGESCAICVAVPDPGDAYRLGLCGHLVCFGCLRVQVLTATPPLHCAREVCFGCDYLTMLDLISHVFFHGS